MSDIARSCLMMNSPFIPPGTPNMAMPIMKAVKYWIHSAYLKEYLSLAGLRPADIEAWMLPIAAARLCEKIPGEEQWLLEMIDNCFHPTPNFLFCLRQ